MKKLLLTTIISLALPMSVHAKNEFIEGDATLGGEAELGATLTTGNTDTASFKTKLLLKQELSDWEILIVSKVLIAKATMKKRRNDSLLMYRVIIK